MSFLDWFRGRAQRRRFPLLWGRGGSVVDIGSRPYADAVYTSIVDLLIGNCRNVELTQTDGDKATYLKVRTFILKKGAEFIARLIGEGVVSVAIDESGEYTFDAEGDEAVWTCVSDDYRIYGKTTKDILAPHLQLLDDVLNAASTTLRKLGLLAILSPRTDEYGNGLTDEELKATEEAFARDYGVLQEQRIVKFLRHDYSIGQITLGGANLQISERLQEAVKMICGKLRVPYELVPAAIVGNPNQTGVYQQEAEKRLAVTFGSYMEYLVSFARSQGVGVEWSNRLAPKGYETAAEDLTAKVIANLQAAEQLGFIDHARAVELYNAKVVE